jgi:hypothetical protein
MALLDDSQALYQGATDVVRRQLNQVFFQRLWIDIDGVTDDEPREPFDGLLHLRTASQQPKRRRATAPAKAKSARAGAPSRAITCASLLDRIAHDEGSSKGAMVVLRGSLSNPGRDLGRLLARRPTAGDVPPAQQPTPRPHRQRRASSELISQMVGEYRAGATTYHLAQQHGLNRNTVAKHLRRAGLRLRGDHVM